MPQQPLTSPGRIVQVIAHPDDDILFNAVELAAFAGAGCDILTVVVSAGEVSCEPARRQAGLIAAHREIGCCTQPVVDPAARVFTYGEHAASVAIISSPGEHAHEFLFMNLPDDRLSGLFDADAVLAAVGHPGFCLPGPGHWSRTDVIGFLAAVFDHWKPAICLTMDPLPDLRLAPPHGDHRDHTAVARLTWDAVREAQTPVHPIALRAYNLRNLPDNMSPTMVARQHRIFNAYSIHDPQFQPIERWVSCCRRSGLQPDIRTSRPDRAGKLAALKRSPLVLDWSTSAVLVPLNPPGPATGTQTRWQNILESSFEEFLGLGAVPLSKPPGTTVVASPEIVLSDTSRPVVVWPCADGIWTTALDSGGAQASNRELIVASSEVFAIAACRGIDGVLHLAYSNFAGEVFITKQSGTGCEPPVLVDGISSTGAIALAWDPARGLLIAATCMPASAGPVVRVFNLDDHKTPAQIGPDLAINITDELAILIGTGHLRVAGWDEDRHFVIARLDRPLTTSRIAGLRHAIPVATTPDEWVVVCQTISGECFTKPPPLARRLV